MINIPLVEILGRGIPEGFLYTFGSYVFSKTAINKKIYLLSSILMAMALILTKCLPIHYGVHTILNIFMLIVINTNINKIDIIKSIKAVISIITFMLIGEGINMFIVEHILDVDIKYIFNNPVLKTIYGIPSLLIVILITGLYYTRLLKRKELKYVEYR